MLLPLGSFLAGLNLASLELCFLGLVLALAVPAVSWVKQSMLFVILAGAFVVKIVGSYTNVVGLPLYESLALLSGEGYPVQFGWLNAAV